MKNILITSAGRRVSLVKEFQLAATEIDAGIKVFTTDRAPSLAPACHVSDGSFQVSSVISNNYINELLEICTANSIGVIIPTIDTCLPILSSNKHRFEEYGIHVIVSYLDFVTICSDKRKTSKFFLEHGIRCPKSVDIKNPTYPMFAKPINGSSSKGIHTILSESDLSESIKNDPNLMFMEYIDKNDYKEFTVDVYYGRDNHVKCIVPRERIEVRGGEVSKGITRKNYLLDYIKERFEIFPGVVGCICFQLFYRELDNDVVGIEMNPRFGGGYPLSYHAGANFPLMLMREYIKSESLNYSDNWHDKTIMLRYDSEVIIDGNATSCYF